MDQGVEGQRLPDLAGLFSLLLLCVPTYIFAQRYGVSLGLWVLVCVLWVARALFVWAKLKGSTSAKQWLLFVGYSVGGGLGWYLFARAVAHITFSNEPQLSWLIDTVISLVIAPGLTFIFLAGWVRQMVSDRQERR